MNGLLQSRKFWLLILDTAISLLLFFVGKYATPALAEDIVIVIAALQPVFVAVIVGIAVEDAAAKRAGLRTTVNNVPSVWHTDPSTGYVTSETTVSE